jgi:colanic acid/amylovoran biosynthesis glycosyltransferase
VSNGTEIRSLGYLISRYPAISHTFIFRELAGLRDRGVFVNVASINDPDRPDTELPEDERLAASRTYYVKSAGASAAFKAIGAILQSHPAGLFNALGAALKLGWKNPRHLPLHLFYWAEAVLIYQWARERSIRHLHVHFATQVATVALILSRGFNVPISFTVHGPDEFDNTTEFHLTEKMEAARFIICIGYFCKSQLMKLCDPRYWSKFHVVRLGVDPEEFVPLAEAPPRDSLQLICVGRLVPQKGQHILIEAISALIQRGTPVHLRLVGDGPDRPSLERQVDRLNLRAHVTFTGSVNRDQVAGLLELSDLFVLASFAEGIPVALMEAMAREIPVISTYIAGIPELIRPGIDGILVPPSDVDSLASAIQQVAADPELRQRLGRAGRRRVLDCFNLPVNLDHLAGVFKSHLAAAGDVTIGR